MQAYVSELGASFQRLEHAKQSFESLLQKSLEKFPVVIEVVEWKNKFEKLFEITKVDVEAPVYNGTIGQENDIADHIDQVGLKSTVFDGDKEQQEGDGGILEEDIGMSSGLGNVLKLPIMRTDDVGTSLNMDATLESDSQFFSNPDVIQELVGAMDSVGKTKETTIPSKPSFSLGISFSNGIQQKDTIEDEATSKQTFIADESRNLTEGFMEETVIKPVGQICSPYLNRKVELDDDLTDGEKIISEWVFAMLGDPL